MKRLTTYLLLLLCALLCVQCERRPLVDPGNTHYVRVYLDEELKNITTGFYDPSLPAPGYAAPEVLHVALCDPSGGRVVAERYLRDQGHDARGHYYEGYIIADPGRYHLLVYNFDTETTLVRNAHLYWKAEAYTDEIDSYLLDRLPNRAGSDERVVRTPDHLFVDHHEDVAVPFTDRVDTLRNAAGEPFFASSLVKSYYLQIRVKGIQWISSATAMLTGMAGSAVLHESHAREDDPATIYFDMQRADAAQRTGGESVLYTTFNTFGKLPDRSNELKVTFNIITTDGRALTATIDITEKFSEPDAVERQWLLLQEVIDIPEPDKPGGGGGFSPDVDDWEDITTDIII